MNEGSSPKTTERCPVPAEQVPIREYEDMRESWFYRWGTQTLRGYLIPVGVLWLVSWLIVGPVAAVSFSPQRALIQFLVSATLGALVIPALALTQLYLGWAYVGNRLRNAEVPYEESGWYDGQVWQKPDDISSRDRLIVDYQVQPILQRITKTFAAMALLVGLGMVGWQFL
jgi:Conserved in the green lineage and diatoms 27